MEKIKFYMDWMRVALIEDARKGNTEEFDYLVQEARKDNVYLVGDYDDLDKSSY